MMTVALIGPDGAGKTTIAERLPAALPFEVVMIYMGDNPDALTHSLPTTRLLNHLRRRTGRFRPSGPADPLRMRATPKGTRRVLVEGRAFARLANQLGEELYRQAIAWWSVRRGRLVLFDRHFYADYHAYDVEGAGLYRPLARRLHGYFLKHLYPHPDLTIVLDASPSTLLSRKNEGTLELLQRRRDDYRRLAGRSDRYAIVDADLPIDEVVRAVAAIIAGRSGPSGGNSR